jgi:hypothetical protein
MYILQEKQAAMPNNIPALTKRKLPFCLKGVTFPRR